MAGEYRLQHGWRPTNDPYRPYGPPHEYKLGWDYVPRQNPPPPIPKPLTDAEIQGIMKCVGDVSNAVIDIGEGSYEEICKPVFWWCNSLTNKLFGI